MPRRVQSTGSSIHLSKRKICPNYPSHRSGRYRCLSVHSEAKEELKGGGNPPTEGQFLTSIKPIFTEHDSRAGCLEPICGLGPCRCRRSPLLCHPNQKLDRNIYL